VFGGDRVRMVGNEPQIRKISNFYILYFWNINRVVNLVMAFFSYSVREFSFQDIN